MSKIDREFPPYSFVYFSPVTTHPTESRVVPDDFRRFVRQIVPPTVEHELAEIVETWGPDLYPSNPRHAAPEGQTPKIVTRDSAASELITRSAQPPRRRTQEVRRHRGSGFLANFLRRRKPQ